MNNYLANIAARTLNPDPVVRPRLSGRFEPTPVLREPSFESWAVNRLRAELPSHIDADIDSPAFDETHGRRRADVRRERALDLRPETAPSDAPSRDINVAIASTANDSISPSPPLTIRAPEHQTLVMPEASQGTTRFEERSIENQGEVALETRKANSPKPRRMLRVESRFDEPAPRPASHHTEAAVDERVPAAADRSPKRATPSLNVRDDEQRLEPSLARGRPVVERELETVIIREKRIVDESGRGSGSTPKAEASRAPVLSDEREQPGAKVVPVAVQPLIAPKVELVPERIPLNRSDAQTQPTVHVTIGRIEIRAVQSPQPAVKPRATPPVMNLDDYLRRRSQGSAR